MKKLSWIIVQLLFIFLAGTSSAQQEDAFKGEVSLEDLSFFQSTSSNWRIVSEVQSDLEKEAVLHTSEGTGVLVNLPDESNRGNIMSVMEHGDIDLSFEFMMAKHSNSGVYLQGRYEVQLFDSWGKERPTYQDCGAIYGRWDEDRPEGYKSYEGYAPRINACRAPGLWQKMKISFQAPRFAPDGKKTAHAKILLVELNGTVLHENVSLTGPTRGPLYEEEAPTGPLFIQGDHGPVAFRNIEYTIYEPTTLALEDLSYNVYKGSFADWPDASKLSPDYSGEMEVLTQQVVSEKEDFLLQVKSSIDLPSNGEYKFQLGTSGEGVLLIDGEIIGGPAYWLSDHQATLTAGKHELEIQYHKPDAWYNNGLGLFISGPGLRPQPLHSLGSVPLSNPTDPILVKTGNKPQILRSFMDFQPSEDVPSRRIVHAISVGFPNGTSYTFDSDRAALVQVWKGGFLDATPMWNNRGDGSADPMGSLLKLGNEANVGMLLQSSSAWSDSLPEIMDYRFKGYMLDAKGVPTFVYHLGEAECHDKISLASGGNHLQREVKVTSALQNDLYFMLASGENIVSMDNNMYSVDQRYYIQLSSGSNSKPMLRDSRGRKELLMPVSAKKGNAEFAYSIVW